MTEPKYKAGDLIAEPVGSPNEKVCPVGLILSHHCASHIDNDGDPVNDSWYMVLEGEEVVEWDGEYVDSQMVKIA